MILRPLAAAACVRKREAKADNEADPSAPRAGPAARPPCIQSLSLLRALSPLCAPACWLGFWVSCRIAADFSDESLLPRPFGGHEPDGRAFKLRLVPGILRLRRREMVTIALILCAGCCSFLLMVVWSGARLVTLPALPLLLVRPLPNVSCTQGFGVGAPKPQGVQGVEVKKEPMAHVEGQDVLHSQARMGEGSGGGDAARGQTLGAPPQTDEGGCHGFDGHAYSAEHELVGAVLALVSFTSNLDAPLFASTPLVGSWPTASRGRLLLVAASGTACPEPIKCLRSLRVSRLSRGGASSRPLALLLRVLNDLCWSRPCVLDGAGLPEDITGVIDAQDGDIWDVLVDPDAGWTLAWSFTAPVGP